MGARVWKAIEHALFPPGSYKSRRWSYKRTQVLLANYGDILDKISTDDKEWAERFEAFLYSIETGWRADARRLHEELQGRALDPNTCKAIGKAADVHKRTNPQRAETERRWNKKRAKTARKQVNGRYSSDDLIQAQVISPEDRVVEVIDMAKSFGLDLEGYFAQYELWSKPRGRGRPRKIKDE